MKKFFSLYGFRLALFAIAAVILLKGITSASKANSHEQKEFLRSSINRAVVTCYALEGFYPESLDYLIENYNVQVDESKYVVHYSIFASNIMPEIDVFERYS